VGLSAMAISGIGVMIVGIFPENGVPAFHGLGALIAFTIGNAALIIMAAAPMIPNALRVYSFLSGALAVLALAVYSTGHYLGLGEGGMERVVAYPQTVWLIVIGIFLLGRIPAGLIAQPASSGPVRPWRALLGWPGPRPCRARPPW
jgi:hypothetical membrane protein